MIRFRPIVALLRLRGIRYYAVPFCLALLALVLTMQVPDVHLQSFFSLFLAAVAISAYLGGWRAGAIASAFSVLASDVFVLPPTWSNTLRAADQATRLSTALRIDSRSDWIRLGAFALTSFVICVLAALIERKEHALRGAQQDLTEQQQEMEFLKSTAKIWSWEYDLRTRRVTWTNMYTPLPLRREEPLESWLNTIHAEDRAQVTAELDRALVDGEFEAEYRVLIDGAEPRRVLGRAVLYSIGGQMAGLRGIEIDRELRAVPVNV